MNASRSRREVTSETSIFDTDNGPSYARLCRWLVRHIISGPLIASSLAGGQRIEVRGPKAHASCQSEPSPLKHLAGRISITLLQPTRNLALKQFAGCTTQLFEPRREHFLLASEIQIECEKQFVPRPLTPAPASVLRAQSGGGIHAGPCSVCYKVQIGAAEIISRCTL